MLLLTCVSDGSHIATESLCTINHEWLQLGAICNMLCLEHCKFVVSVIKMNWHFLYL